MSSEALYQDFKSLMQSEFSIPEPKITMDTLLVEDLGLDSLDLLSASLAIEDRWDIRIPDEELPNLKTVGDAFRWVEARLEPQT